MLHNNMLLSSKHEFRYFPHGHNQDYSDYSEVYKRDFYTITLEYDC